MLVNTKAKRLDIPGEPGQWMELRPLSFAEEDRLRRESSAAFLAEMAAMPDAVMNAQMRMQTEDARRRREENARRAEAGEPALPDPDLPDPDLLDGQDLVTILECGIGAWSYAQPGEEEMAPVAGAVKMLDEGTARWAGREILRLTWPERATEIDAEIAGGSQPPADSLDSGGSHA